jgi:outer membrane autotransporter protein
MKSGESKKLCRVTTALMLSVSFAAVDRAGAACDQTTSTANPVNNTTVTCSGTTTNQNDPNGWGTGAETGDTINVQTGATVTGTAAGINVNDGTVNNGDAVSSGGAISATATGGIAINAGGAVTVGNFGDGITTGVIKADQNAIKAQTITISGNTGRIESTGGGGIAVLSAGDLNVSNLSGGLITALHRAVSSSGNANIINSAGAVIEATGSGTDGTAVQASNLVLDNSGVIRATGADAIGAIEITNTGTSIKNSGTISTAGITPQGSFAVGSDFGGLTVNNLSGGSIQALNGNSFAIIAGRAATADASVTNAGVISATGSGGIAIQASGTATVSNTGDGVTTGIISGDTSAIKANTVIVNTNSGLIKANDTAIDASADGGTANVINSGTISAAGIAINTDRLLQLDNTGLVRSVGSVALRSDQGDINVNNGNATTPGGTISANATGAVAIVAESGIATVSNFGDGVISGDAIGIKANTVNVTGNTGVIEARSASGAQAIFANQDANITSSGTIRANGTAGGNSAITAGHDAAVINSGHIEATGIDGTGIVVGHNLDVTNPGTIQASLFGVRALTGNLSLTNPGQIVVTQAPNTGGFATGGVAVDGGTGIGIGAVTVNNSNLIQGVSNAIRGNGFVTVDPNSGTIKATDASGAVIFSGIAISGVAVTVNNLAAGNITGPAGGITASGPVTINANAGMIEATGVNGIAINATTAATITNSGTIRSDNGVAIQAGGLATVTNLSGGNITAGGTAIIAATLDITNAQGATISAGANGISGSGIVRNAGTISGNAASVSFSGPGPNTLILQTGSVLNGDAIGATGASNSLILQGHGTAANNFLGFGSLDVQADTAWTWNTSANFGATAVNSGTLAVDGTLVSPVTVNGTLAGRGTVSGNISVAGGGAIAPGALVPFSTLTTTGNVNFQTGSIYRVNVNAAGQNDKLATGTATLTGGTVNVLAQAGGTFAPSTQYTILTASGGGLGGTNTFSGVTTNLAFLTPSLSYDANDVFLTLATNGGGGGGTGGFGFANVALTRNQRGVAGALDASPVGSALVTALLSQTAAGARQAFDALSGEVFGTLHNTQSEEAQFARSTMLSRMRQISYGGIPGDLGALGFGGPALAYAAGDAYAADLLVKAAPGAAERSRDLTFWAQGLGGWGHADSDGNAASLRSRFGGFLSGADARFGETWRAGLVAGYMRSDLHVDARASSAGIDSVQFGGYAAGKVGAFNVRGGASYSLDEINASRGIFFPGFTDQTHARFHGNVGQVFGEVGYGMAFGRVAVEPLAGLAYVHVHDNSFLETGGAAALAGARANEDTGYSSLGVRMATAMPLANGTVLVPRATLAWQHAFGDVTPTSALAFQGTGAAFTVAGIPIARDAALVEAGFDWRFSPHARLGAFYQGELAAHADTHAVKGTFTWDF